MSGTCTRHPAARRCLAVGSQLDARTGGPGIRMKSDDMFSPKVLQRAHATRAMPQDCDRLQIRSVSWLLWTRSRPQLICPTGALARILVKPWRGKYSYFQKFGFGVWSLPFRADMRGVTRRHETWCGIAVDAKGRLTSGAFADGEVVWS